jgi:glycosyltransferase involved in cell wall biosynthesis
VQTYIRELLRHMPEVVDADLAAVVPADAVGELPAGVRPVVRSVANTWTRGLAGIVAVPGSDLVHGLDVDLPFRPRTPTVATIHDLSAFDVPWSYSRLHGAAERRILAATVRRADAVIAVSMFTAGRLRERFGRDAVVIPIAPSPRLGPPEPREIDRVRAAYRLPERFVLHVGDIGPRKDVASLASACRLAGVPLVLAGNVQGHTSIPAGALALGHVAEADLAPLYGAATVVGYPSLYEGFGLPALESMACGAAVVATNVPAVDEILGETVERVSPGDVEGMARVLRCLVNDEDRRRTLAAAGRERAAGLTWHGTATATAQVYRSLGLEG